MLTGVRAAAWGHRMGRVGGRVQPRTRDCGSHSESPHLLLAAVSCPLGEGTQPTRQLEPGASAAALGLDPPLPPPPPPRPRQGQLGRGLLMFLEVLSLGPESVSSEKREEGCKGQMCGVWRWADPGHRLTSSCPGEGEICRDLEEQSRGPLAQEVEYRAPKNITGCSSGCVAGLVEPKGS